MAVDVGRERRLPSLGGERLREAGVGLRIRPYSRLRPLPAVPDGVRVLRQRAPVGWDHRERGYVGLDNYRELWHDEAFWTWPPGRPTALWNTVYYALLVVPLQMALGLTMALIVNAAIHGTDLLPLGLLLPGARLLGGDLRDRAVPPQRRRARQRRHQRGHRAGLRSALVRRSRHRARVARRPRRVDDLGDDDALLPRRPAVGPDRRLRGSGDRQGEHVAHVLEDHVPAGLRRTSSSRSCPSSGHSSSSIRPTSSRRAPAGRPGRP